MGNGEEEGWTLLSQIKVRTKVGSLNASFTDVNRKWTTIANTMFSLVARRGKGHFVYFLVVVSKSRRGERYVGDCRQLLMSECGACPASGMSQSGSVAERD